MLFKFLLIRSVNAFCLIVVAFFQDGLGCLFTFLDEDDREHSVHFFLRCPHFSALRAVLLSKISDIIGSDLSLLPDEQIFNIIVYGSNVYSVAVNGLIIIETISYMRKSGRFVKLEAFG